MVKIDNEFGNDVYSVAFPNLVVKSNGDYCGDYIEYRIQFINDKIILELINDSCYLSSISSEYILSKLQMVSIESYLYYFNRDSEDYYNEILEYCNLSSVSHRKSCILNPFNILKESIPSLLKNIEFTCNVDDSIVKNNSILECDTCIRVKSIKSKKLKKNNRKNKSYVKAVLEKDAYTIMGSNLENILGINPLSLCKVNLLKSDIDGLYKLSAYWDDEYLMYFKVQKVACILFENLRRNNIKIPLSLINEYNKKIKKLRIYEHYLYEIKKYLNFYNISYSLIKGIALSNMYREHGFIRTYYDIDILVHNFKDFINCSNILVSELGFDHFNELGMAFSIKKIFNSVHGHAHFARIVDEVEVNIDINFPSLVNDNSNLIDYNSEGNVEKLIVFLVSHAFKHDILPIKELNDLFIILKKNIFDKKILYELLIKNNLLFKFEIMISTLQLNYDYSGKFYIDLLSRYDKNMIKIINSKGGLFNKVIYRMIKLYINLFSKNLNNSICNNDLEIFPKEMLKKLEDRLYVIPLKRKLNPESNENIEFIKGLNGYFMITSNYIYSFTDRVDKIYDDISNWYSELNSILQKDGKNNVFIDKFVYIDKTLEWYCI